VEVDGNEARKSPNPANRQDAKSTSDLKSSAMLHLGKFGNLALTAGTRVIPELAAIYHDRHDT
jgi:hypothetical protein